MMHRRRACRPGIVRVAFWGWRASTSTLDARHECSIVPAGSDGLMTWATPLGGEVAQIRSSWPLRNRWRCDSQLNPPTISNESRDIYFSKTILACGCLSAIAASVCLCGISGDSKLLRHRNMLPNHKRAYQQRGHFDRLFFICVAFTVMHMEAGRRKPFPPDALASIDPEKSVGQIFLYFLLADGRTHTIIALVHVRDFFCAVRLRHKQQLLPILRTLEQREQNRRIRF